MEQTDEPYAYTGDDPVNEVDPSGLFFHVPNPGIESTGNPTPEPINVNIGYGILGSMGSDTGNATPVLDLGEGWKPSSESSSRALSIRGRRP